MCTYKNVIYCTDKMFYYTFKYHVSVYTPTCKLVIVLFLVPKILNQIMYFGIIIFV